MSLVNSWAWAPAASLTSTTTRSGGMPSGRSRRAQAVAEARTSARSPSGGQSPGGAPVGRSARAVCIGDRSWSFSFTGTSRNGRGGNPLTVARRLMPHHLFGCQPFIAPTIRTGQARPAWRAREVRSPGRPSPRGSSLCGDQGRWISRLPPPTGVPAASSAPSWVSSTTSPVTRFQIRTRRESPAGSSTTATSNS